MVEGLGVFSQDVSAHVVEFQCHIDLIVAFSLWGSSLAMVSFPFPALDS